MSLKLDTSTRYVQVKFEGGGQQYSYLCNFDVQVGDYVLVVPRNFPTVAKVTKVTNAEMKAAKKHIAGVVDLSEYEKILAREEHIKETKAKLEAKRKKFEEVAMYRLLAKEDPEVAALLKELENA